jgi:hypothetical protein
MAWRADARSNGAGVREVRVLEGNIGYLRLSTFYPLDLARPKLAAAFTLLADTDGLVLDLRQNGAAMMQRRPAGAHPAGREDHRGAAAGAAWPAHAGTAAASQPACT